jgi:hypothetical protein
MKWNDFVEITFDGSIKYRRLGYRRLGFPDKGHLQVVQAAAIEPDLFVALFGMGGMIGNTRGMQQFVEEQSNAYLLREDQYQ